MFCQFSVEAPSCPALYTLRITNWEPLVTSFAKIHIGAHVCKEYPVTNLILYNAGKCWLQGGESWSRNHPRLEQQANQCRRGEVTTASSDKNPRTCVLILSKSIMHEIRKKKPKLLWYNIQKKNQKLKEIFAIQN